jgi:hypothetical protein
MARIIRGGVDMLLVQALFAEGVLAVLLCCNRLAKLTNESIESIHTFYFPAPKKSPKHTKGI